MEEERTVKPNQEKIRRMLNELGRALIEALEGSDDALGTVRQIRREGYSLYLVMGCTDEETEDGEAARGVESHRALPPKRELPALPPAREPVFRLSPEDVAFLNSIGIDPTRAPRRRRSA